MIRGVTFRPEKTPLGHYGQSQSQPKKITITPPQSLLPNWGMGVPQMLRLSPQQANGNNLGPISGNLKLPPKEHSKSKGHFIQIEGVRSREFKSTPGSLGL